MKFIAIALFAIVAVAAAAEIPHDVDHVDHVDHVEHQIRADHIHGVHPEMHAEVLRSDSVVLPDSFEYNFETSNGIKAGASGQLKQIGKDEEAVVEQGSFAYTAPDGTPIQLSYIADETGYHPTGAHLPTPPPIPEAIARSLEWIAARQQVLPNVPLPHLGQDLPPI